MIMFNKRTRGLTLMALSWLGASAVHAQRPAGNDTSDTLQNTGMGTGALVNTTSGSGNTAAGDGAL